MKVLVTETIGASGMGLLKEHVQVDIQKGLSEDALCEILGAYDGLVVRSSTDVNARVIAAGKNLRVIGRAGTGVDNIDVEAATRQGILVVNAPTGNSNAVAEQTIALMLCLARRLHPAISSMKEGRWEKSALQGVEVRGKTLGLVGLGRIGAMVASKARALEMRVVAYDPYISSDHAASMGVELNSLDNVLATADFISVHTPLTPQTEGMLDETQLRKMKAGAYIINCARGGIIDEDSLFRVLSDRAIAGAALDVFAVEPAVDNCLVCLDNVIATPHLAASTAEAQESVAYDVAEAVVDVLEGRIPKSPVNVPYLPPQAADLLRPYVDLAQRLGSFFVQWRGGLLGRLELIFEGQICNHDTRILTNAFLAGLLAPATEEPISIVNARQIADRQGLRISETSHKQTVRHGSRISARFPDSDTPSDIAGAMVQEQPSLVTLDSQRLECVLQGRMLADLHHDRPGIVGGIATVLGGVGINISFVQMSRAHRGGPSIMVLGLDEEAPPSLMPAFLQVPNVQRVRMISLPSFAEPDDGDLA